MRRHGGGARGEGLRNVPLPESSDRVAFDPLADDIDARAWGSDPFAHEIDARPGAGVDPFAAEHSCPGAVSRPASSAVSEASDPDSHYNFVYRNLIRSFMRTIRHRMRRPVPSDNWTHPRRGNVQVDRALWLVRNGPPESAGDRSARLCDIPPRSGAPDRGKPQALSH
jgi:hypothetical protein